MAALPTTRPQPRAVTASAAKLTRKESAYAKRVAQPWQWRALDIYDLIGELRYASHFYARQISRVRYYPALLKDDGSTEPIETGEPVDLLNRIQDPGGGRERLQFDYGRLMFVTGEGVLFGYGPDEEQWKFLWKDEVKILEDGTAVRLDFQKQETAERGTGYRFWTPHPRHSDLPDSPLRPVLDIAEELIILTQSVRSTATTRMTNGILALATELEPVPDDPGTDEDPEQSPFLSDFMDHVQAQIDDPGSAAAKVPYLLVGAYDYLKNGEGVQWIKTHDPATDYMERDLRIEAIKRLALSLDMPPEALLGMTDANHWTAKQVQHDMWRAHGASIASRFGDDLADAYLRPALADAGYADWRKVVVAYDDSQVVISPDRTENANDALDRLAIGFPGYRELMGIEESMAPTQEEKDFLAALKLRQPPLDWVDPTSALTNPARGPVGKPSTNGNAANGPPTPTDGRTGSRQEAMTASLLGAASLAVRQCRAKAGARLRDYRTRCPDCLERVSDQPNSMVASALGVDQVFEWAGKDTYALVKGGADEFRGLLGELGLVDREAEGLCQRIEMYAAKTLFEQAQPELPPGFVAQIEGALELSHLQEAV